MSKPKKALSLMLAIMFFIFAFPINASAATQSQLRSKVVSVAQSQVGYTGSSTYSKYGEWYGYQGGWCTTFVLWCFNQAGTSCNADLYGNIVPSGGNCNSMISWYSSNGRYYKQGSYTPKAGDLVFFDWSGNGSSQHVGIVKSFSSGTLYTIEGNCSGCVKSREYTSDGSKPYNNISSVMGYGAPDYACVSGTGAAETKSSASTTKKKTQTTEKKQSTTEKKTTAQAAKEDSTEKETTKQPDVESLTISASTYDLKVGDTVKLNYSTEPENAPAVIGYFCDDEGIIEIGSGGDIKAVGEGSATVVVCANNELYSQCDFTVTEAKGAVTSTQSSTRKVVGTVQNTETTKASVEKVLTNLGVNVSALKEYRQFYIIPLTIICSTAFISIFAASVKRIKKKK